jgi:predicted signal transduction protein with EAL and GGDEF domain
MYGKGLNSIRARFTLLIGGFCLIGAVVMALFVAPHPTTVYALAGEVALIALLCIVPAAITYVMAGNLVGSIHALKRSTEAIVNGDMDRPVEVDCSCEVGGLADSFRKMVGKLNSNIMRMNILAYNDPLTGLANRVVIQHMLALSLDGRHETPFRGAVLFIDLDGFKVINDSHGHEVGDELLRAASQRIVERGLGRTTETLDNCTTPFGELCDRMPNDIVFGRFAGDEFVAILPGVEDAATLSAMADAILAALSEPFLIEGQLVSISASIGIARTPHDTTSVSEILVFADMAMYAAKQNGRARYAFFDAALRTQVLERIDLERELHEALQNDELVLHYQPKVDARTLEVTGAEALVRWQHPTRGLLPPSAFLDIAEKGDMICELGSVVFRRAFKQIKAWEKLGVRLPIAVNVSASQFANPELCARIRRMMDQYGVDPALVELEVTESVAMQDYEAADSKLRELQSVGIRMSIDDFGVGFSNLTQLVNLPFDTLKIDRSLVADIGRSRKSEAVVQALLGIAAEMGQDTVAEGIERQEEVDFLSRHGCTTLQGYLFAHPLPPGAFLEWVMQHRAAHRPLGLAS